MERSLICVDLSDAARRDAKSEVHEITGDPFLTRWHCTYAGGCRFRLRRCARIRSSAISTIRSSTCSRFCRTQALLALWGPRRFPLPLFPIASVMDVMVALRVP